jgi:two-component system cell cycle sensor histidine kinase/response regulator CckA
MEPAAVPQTILVVDDDRALRTLICRSLTKHGFEALEAIDAESALVLFHANQSRIALVISDMVMPGMDGPALMRELLHTRPDLNVLFITGTGLPSAVSRACRSPS